MAPTRSKKGVSDQSTASTKHLDTASSRMPIKNSGPSTPPERSPIKKRKMGITMPQKQALIENLRLEITERARRLRAQYHLQAQGLRSRIDIRINRIPISLRRMKMEDVLLKCIEQEQKRGPASRPPPVPIKDLPSRESPFKFTRADPRTKAAGRPQKRISDEISVDKENENQHGEHPKKRARGGQATGGVPGRAAQILSPTSSNSRLKNMERPASPIKPPLSRPGSPLKSNGSGLSTSAATNVLSSMVEKAKATRAGGARKVTAASNASSSSASTAPATQTRRGPAAKAPASRPATRTGRRASGISETSEGSAGSVVRKPAGPRAAAAPTKKTAKGTVRKVANEEPAKKSGTAAASLAAGTRRILRKRG